jgi:hypothetical protein
MTEQHPITPPPELVQQWWAEETYDPFGVAVSNLANRAAQWGADQELEACCEWLRKNVGRWEIPLALRDARRPKPPSLKARLKEAIQNKDLDTALRLVEVLNDPL